MKKPRGKKLPLTQNRRWVAQLVASRTAEEMDSLLGAVVGLKSRGRNESSNVARLDVVTDGTLIMAAKSDPSLSTFSVIVVDEAHQHTV